VAVFQGQTQHKGEPPAQKYHGKWNLPPLQSPWRRHASCIFSCQTSRDEWQRIGLSVISATDDINLWAVPAIPEADLATWAPSVLLTHFHGTRGMLGMAPSSEERRSIGAALSLGYATT